MCLNGTATMRKFDEEAMQSAVNTIALFLLLLVFPACMQDGLRRADDARHAGAERPEEMSVPATVTGPEQGFRAALHAYETGDPTTALSLAQQVAANYHHSVWRNRALFLAERALIRLDRPAEADQAMEAVRTSYPALAAYAVFLDGEYYFKAARYDRAAARYAEVTARVRRGPLAERASFQLGRALLRLGDPASAAKRLAEFLQEFPQSDRAPQAGLELSQALAGEGRLADAAQAAREVWLRYPGGTTDREALRQLAELRTQGVSVPGFTVHEQYTRAMRLFRLLRYAEAAAALGPLLAETPSFPERPDALFQFGTALTFLGRRGEAAAAFAEFVRRYPNDSRVPAAMLGLGKCRAKLGDVRQGESVLTRLVKRFPGSKWAADALYAFGNLRRGANDEKDARRTYARLVREYPNSKYADSALWWSGWSCFRAGEYRAAEDTLQELIRRYPGSFLVHQARYWQGRAAELRHAPDAAAEYYDRLLEHGPYTFYGYLAADRMARLAASGTVRPADSPDLVAVVCADENCPDADDPSLWTAETERLLSADPSFGTTRELMYQDMKQEAADELAALMHSGSLPRGTIIGLSKAYAALGDYSRSLRLVLDHYAQRLDAPRKGTPPDLWLLAYPQGYWDDVVAAARRFGQDPYFIAAVIRAESKFSPKALSPAGARGVMQIMPDTGAWAAARLKMHGFDRQRLFESDTGIAIGTWYLARLMKRFHGDPLLAAAAYNAGPDAVASWIGPDGAIGERDVFIESIPYTETRSYVKKVLRNYAEYRRLYGQAAGTLALAPGEGHLKQETGWTN